MRKHIGIVAALMVFFLIAPVAGAAFPDVPADHWAYEAISQLVAAGLIEGMPDGTYQGNQPVTRFTMALYIARAMERLEQMIADEVARATDSTIADRVIERLQTESFVVETQKVIETVVEVPVEVEKIIERQIINRVGVDSEEIRALVLASIEDVLAPLAALIKEYDDQLAQLRRDMNVEFERMEKYVLGHVIVPGLRIEMAKAVAEVQGQVWDLESALAAGLAGVRKDLAVEIERMEKYVLGHVIVPGLRIEMAKAVAEVQNDLWALEGRLDAEVASLRNELAVEMERMEKYVLGHVIVPGLRIEMAKAVGEVQSQVWDLQSELAALESRVAKLEDPKFSVSGTLNSKFEDVYVVGGVAYKDPNQWTGDDPPVWTNGAVFYNELLMNTKFRQQDGGVVVVDLRTTAINRFGYGVDANTMSLFPQVTVTTPGSLRNLKLGNVTVPTWSGYTLTRFPGLADSGKTGEGALVNLVFSDVLKTDLILVRADGAVAPNYYWAGRTLAQVLPSTQVGLTYVAANPGPMASPGLLDPRRDSKVGVSLDSSMGSLGLKAEYVLLPDVDDSAALVTDMTLGLGAINLKGRFVNIAPNFSDVYGTDFGASAADDFEANYQRIYGEIGIPAVMNLTASANMRTHATRETQEYKAGVTVPVLELNAGVRYNIASDRVDDIIAITVGRKFGTFGLEAGYGMRGDDAKIHASLTSSALSMGAFNVTPGLTFRQDGAWNDDASWDSSQVVTGTLDIAGGALTLNNVVLYDNADLKARTRLTIKDMIKIADFRLSPRATYEYKTFWKDAPTAQETRYSLGAEVVTKMKDFTVTSDVEYTMDDTQDIMVSSKVSYPVLSNVNLGLTGTYVQQIGDANNGNKAYRATGLLATMSVTF